MGKINALKLKNGGLLILANTSTDEWHDRISHAEDANIYCTIGTDLLPRYASLSNEYRLSNGIRLKVTRSAARDMTSNLYSVSLQFTRADGTILFTISGAFGYNYFSFGLYYDDDGGRIMYLGDYADSRPITRQGETYSNIITPMDKSIIEEIVDGSIENDPYITPDSGDNGGDGKHDNTDDPIDLPELPDISASSTGFITVYRPSLGQLSAFGNYLWSNEFNIDNIKKIFADPWEGIIGLMLLPLDVPTSGSRNVKVGNAETSISMPVVSNQYVEINCGSVTINEYWGSYLDYSPHTTIEIYLPYCGFRTLDVDVVMGKSINVVYRVDVLSGALVSIIKVGGKVMYTFSGSCAQQIPITSSNFSGVISGAISTGLGVVSALVTKGMSAPMAVGAIGATASNVASSKTHVEKSGNVTGGSGILGVQKPYLVITRPILCKPKNQNNYMGYPSFTTRLIGSLKGYTKVDSIHMDNFTCLADELSELEKILKDGFII